MALLLLTLLLALPPSLSGYTTEELAVIRLLQSSYRADVLEGVRRVEQGRWTVFKPYLMPLLNNNFHYLFVKKRERERSADYRFISRIVDLFLTKDPRAMLPILRRNIKRLIRYEYYRLVALVFSYSDARERGKILKQILSISNKKKVYELLAAVRIPLIGDEEEWNNILGILLQSKTVSVRKYAISLMMTRKPADATLLRCLMSGDGATLPLCLDVAAKWHPRGAVPLLMNIVSSPSHYNELREKATIVLSKYGSYPSLGTHLLREGKYYGLLLIDPESRDGSWLRNMLAVLYGIDAPPPSSDPALVRWVLRLHTTSTDALWAHSRLDSARGLGQRLLLLVVLKHLSDLTVSKAFATIRTIWPDGVTPSLALLSAGFYTPTGAGMMVRLLRHFPQGTAALLHEWSVGGLVDGRLFVNLVSALPSTDFRNQLPSLLDFASRHLPITELGPVVPFFVHVMKRDDVPLHLRMAVFRLLLRHGVSAMGAYLRRWTAEIREWRDAMEWGNILLGHAHRLNVRALVDGHLEDEGIVGIVSRFVVWNLSARGILRMKYERAGDAFSYFWPLSDREILEEIRSHDLPGETVAALLSLLAPGDVGVDGLRLPRTDGYLPHKFLTDEKRAYAVITSQDECAAVAASLSPAGARLGRKYTRTVEDDLVAMNLSHPFDPSMERHSLLVRLVSASVRQRVKCVLVRVGYRTVPVPYPHDGILFVRHLPPGTATIEMVR